MWRDALAELMRSGDRRDSKQTGRFDIPVVFRLALSVLPAIVLYRVSRLFYYHLRFGGRVRAVTLEVAAIGVAFLALYFAWRNVALEDFKFWKRSGTDRLF